MSDTLDQLTKVKRDFFAQGIVVAAIVLFVGTGGTALPQAMRAITGVDHSPDRVLVSALLLNIALVIFGLLRINELSQLLVQRSESEAEARIQAATDPLTGCLNRRSFADEIERMLAEAGERHLDLAFLMLDLDNFKHVNDLHSHQAGDAMLRAAAERLREVTPPNSLIARMGGDEFACVVQFDPADTAQVDELAHRIVTQVGSLVVWDGLELKATVSVGIAKCAAREATSAQTLLHMADIAMFHAKRQGRNTVAWFAPAMESELRFRGELQAGIRRGIAAGEFVPYYEKQIDLTTGDLVGFEVLARWHSPTLGVVSPNLFIPIAEQMGLIGELSASVIRQALNDARDWDPRLTLAINISPLQLRDAWFAQKLLKQLVEASFPASRLEVEITESSLHDNIGMVRSIIASLKNQGVRVSIDDFGTGYSSLSQLRSLPFDRIKIDRSFISALPESEENLAIVQSIISLGQGLGLPVTAEGVESEEILRMLDRFEGLKGQGYLFGQPLPASAVAEELKALRPLPGIADVEIPPLLRRAGHG